MSPGLAKMYSSVDSLGFKSGSICIEVLCSFNSSKWNNSCGDQLQMNIEEFIQNIYILKFRLDHFWVNALFDLYILTM